MKITIQDLNYFIENNKGIAYCEITSNVGSSPREKGAWMLVSNEGNILGTVGGGQLEYNLIQKVLLQNWNINFRLNIETTLGPEISQCCGGKVGISIKKMDKDISNQLVEKLEKNISDCPCVLIFGGGNIGTSLALQMHNLPLSVKIIDNRKDFISKINIPTEKKFSLIPEQEVHEALANSCYVIATHDHGLDFLLCYEILKRQDASYIGMIGSKTKKGALENWLRKKGIKNISDVNIPIGKSLFDSYDKRPEIISAHIVSEILSILEKNTHMK